MDRTSIGEHVLWRGKPRPVVLRGPFRAAFWALLATSAIAVASSIAIASTLHTSTSRLVFLAGWCASFALALHRVPQWWHEGAEFLVTDRRVIWKRGRFVRSIEREGITFARIHWYADGSGVGDLELVRDVPLGALRRTLTIELRGVDRPDRLWDVIRGVEVRADDERRPTGQRLEEGERVLWFDRPRATWRRFVPESTKGIATATLAGFVTLAMIRGVVGFVPASRLVLSTGIAPSSIGFLALVASVALTTTLLGGIAGALVWSSVLAPAFRRRDTRYFVTDRRIVIEQGDEELQMDRARVVDVIEAASRQSGRDLYLVLDGRGARAMGMSGAFDEAPGDVLRPVFRGIDDPESVRRILRAA